MPILLITKIIYDVYDKRERSLSRMAMEWDGRLRYQEFRGHKLSRLYYDYQALPFRTVIFEEENTGMFD